MVKHKRSSKRKARKSASKDPMQQLNELVAAVQAASDPSISYEEEMKRLCEAFLGSTRAVLRYADGALRADLIHPRAHSDPDEMDEREELKPKLRSSTVISSSTPRRTWR